MAVLVRASVGRPGGSAQAHYRRRRANEWAAWTRNLSWRAAAILAGGLGAWLLATSCSHRWPGWPACWPPPSWPGRCASRVTVDTRAWRRGATGERHTARLLAPLNRHGWAVLHDLAIPGTQANIDCDDPRRGGRGEV